MTKKTKAQKIASTLRRHSGSVPTSYTATTPANSPVPHHAQTSHYNFNPQLSRVYDATDLNKSVVLSFFMIVCIVFIYVLQYKGYF